MNVQADLFEIATGTTPHSVFPQFKIERPNCDFTGRLTVSEMPVILKKLGFRVGQMRYHKSKILVYPVGECDESSTLFEVEYPAQWTLTKDLQSSVYVGNDNPIRQIHDAHGFLRGVVHCGWDMMPLSATLYTRYSVWSGVPLNFAEAKIDRNEVRSVVVDRTKINPQDPDKLEELLHVDTRWLLAEKYPQIRDMAPEKRSCWIAEHIPERSITVGVNGSTLWLDEHFPDWRDPTAYWPR
jgi:hypothetical protein